jgi:predicted nucleic acid-binding Zn ribbon protein
MSRGPCRFFNTGRTESLSDPLKRFLKKSGVGWMIRHADVVTHWAETVGPEIADKTRVRGLRAGVLTVDVEGAALKSELEQFYSETILKALKTGPVKAVSEIRFRLWQPDPEETDKDHGSNQK